MTTTTEKVKVKLVRKGARACGEYQAGKEYDVAIGEAVRLVSAKGFEYVTPADEKAAKQWADAQAVLEAKAKAEEDAAAKAEQAAKTGES